MILLSSDMVLQQLELVVPSPKLCRYLFDSIALLERKKNEASNGCMNKIKLVM